MHDMKDSGIALMESMDADIHDNTFEDVKYGIRMSLGCSRNRVYRNTFATCRDCESSSSSSLSSLSSMWTASLLLLLLLLVHRDGTFRSCYSSRTQAENADVPAQAAHYRTV